MPNPAQDPEDNTTDLSQEETTYYTPLRFRRSTSQDSWPKTYPDEVPTEWTGNSY